MTITLTLNLFFTEEDDMFLAGCPQLNIMAFGKTTKEAEVEFFRLAERVLRFYRWNGKLDEHLANLGWLENNGSYTYKNKVIPPRGKIVSNKELTHTFTLPTEIKPSKVYQ
jgi:hypothetical protein